MLNHEVLNGLQLHVVGLASGSKRDFDRYGLFPKGFEWPRRHASLPRTPLLVSVAVVSST